MATGGKPPGKPTFLGGEDLLSELDAWDATFDALHETAATPTPDPDRPPMAWPAPQQGGNEETTIGSIPTAPDGNYTIDEELALEPPTREEPVDDQLTIDGAMNLDDGGDQTFDRDVPTQITPDALHDPGQFAAATSVSVPVADRDETDFSDVGLEGEASTAGDLLGSAPKRAPTRLPSSNDDDDGVFTSASRPAPADELNFGDDDDIAPPPMQSVGVAKRPNTRAGTQPGGAIRTPAIVRRAPKITPPPPDDDPFDEGESTRVSSLHEIEQKRIESQKATTIPPINVPLDDDYEIEIDADRAASSSSSMSAAPIEPADSRDSRSEIGSKPDIALPARRTAHVLRRTEGKTKPPPTVPKISVVTPRSHEHEEDDHVIEMDVGSEDDDLEASLPPVPAPLPRPVSDRPSQPVRITPPPPTAGKPILPLPSFPALEDDFSDVAASLGADPSTSLRADPEPAPMPDVDLDVPVEQVSAMFDGRTTVDASPPPPKAMSPMSIDYANQRVKVPTSVIERLEPPASTASATTPPPVREKFPPQKTLAGVAPVPRDSPKPVQIARPAMADLSRAIDLDPALDLETVGRDWPEQEPPLAAHALDEAFAHTLLVYEREIATVDDPTATAALQNEAGRLSENLGDLDRARGHYDEALLADPRSTTALRGLRRIARASGDLNEATRHLDTEIAVAGGLERRPLGHYRVDLLMASGEQDLARVAVGEILDSAPSDVRALLAQLELAFLDGRADEFGSALEQLAHAVSDNELRAAVQSARGVLAAHQNNTAAAATWFAAAAESDPASLAARLGAVRQAAAQADGQGAARALLELALNIQTTDPTMAAAAAVRAQQWGFPLAALAVDGAPDDPLVARLATEAAVATFDAETKRAATYVAPEIPPDDAANDQDVAPDVESARVAAANAFARWARATTIPAERAYAAARAAELDPASGIPLWTAVLENDPGDDYGAAQLRTAHVAADAMQTAIEVDLSVANAATPDDDRFRARLRAAYGLIAIGKLDEAIAVLAGGRTPDAPVSPHLAEALGEALAAANKWTERATLFAELAANPGDQLDRDVATLRSALAWEEAIGAATVAPPEGGVAPPADPSMVGQALDAFTRVLETTPGAPTAHAAMLLLANRTGERTLIADALARTQAVERSPHAIVSLALSRARLTTDLELAEQILRETPQDLDDPRRTLALMLYGARTKQLGDVALVLEERATLLDNSRSEDDKPSLEPAALRLRAAQLALDGGDAVRATSLLHKVEQALPNLGIIQDLLAAARRRSGDRSGSRIEVRSSAPSTSGASKNDAFARIVRDADLSAAQGDNAAALSLYQRALEMRPGDPLATIPLVRVATELRQPAPIAALALAQLRDAETANDNLAKASAYELLARIDADLRDDLGSAQISLESASTADPTRVDLLHRLERLYSEQGQLGELLRLRQSEVDSVPAELVRDRAALLVDLAGLATRDKRTDLEIAALYRAALAADAKTRLALLHLEAVVRRGGASTELADLEDKIAQYFANDPKSSATFATRSGETLAEIGDIDTAVQRFGQAEGILPGHIPALEGWRQAALKGQLWIDVSDAATRQAGTAALADDGKARGALHHFAGVALMDKALVGDQAMVAFKRALDADPAHRDAFLRLRILLEEDGNHDELAILLEKRLDVESDPHAKSELHRALAELCRNFLSDRDNAKKHYRAILEGDPNDLRAHSALADIAWELGSWQEAADALVSRARLEKQPEILKTLCIRLGTIYADFLVDVPLALKAFQQALTYAPGDENALVRLAELATTAGEWKLALGACERLVKHETDPDRRAVHLHRVAKIFKAGFGDAKRAERALNLALDGAPTNDDALQTLVDFYRESNDITSVRVHLNRVAGTMRARAAQDPKDGVAFRVISRVMTARAAAGVGGSAPIARAAAELAESLGQGGEPEKALLVHPPQPASGGAIAPLLKPESDEVLFPRGIQPELRQLFQLLGDRVAKHVGVNLQPYGVARGDRLRAKDSNVAQVAQSVASQLGFGDIDVYISQKQPWVMVAEPTSPVSLVIGSSIGEAGGDAIRFAAGGALKLAQSSLAIPARLAPDDLGVLVVALLRLFQPEFPSLSLDADAIATQLQKLKRLIPNSLVVELRPFALAIDGQRWDHVQLARDLKITALRAGLVASASLLTGLRILAGQAGASLPDFLADPVAQGLVSFAISEDHAVVAR